MWNTRPDFMQVVQITWNTPIIGYTMYQVVRKLKLLKQQLKKLHKQHFSSVADDADKAREDLHRAQFMLNQDPSCAALRMMKKN